MDLLKTYSSGSNTSESSSIWSSPVKIDGQQPKQTPTKSNSSLNLMQRKIKETRRFSNDSELQDEGPVNFEEDERTKTKETKAAIARKNAEENRRKSHENLRNQCSCKQKCLIKIGTTRRREINDHYWCLKPEVKQCFIKENVAQELIKKRKHDNYNDPKKMYSYKYSFKDEQSVQQSVCQAFFLNTLGYERSSTNVIYRSFGIEDGPVPDRRGKYKRNNDLSKAIKKDIMSYNPELSHYRRNNSPNALYLPSDIIRKNMYLNWKSECEKVNKTSGCESLYYKTLNKLNVRFAQRGHEECEECVEFSNHEKEVGHKRTSLDETDSIVCDKCLAWSEHRKRYRKAREVYTSLKESKQPGHLVTSADLQKVNIYYF